MVLERYKHNNKKAEVVMAPCYKLGKKNGKGKIEENICCIKNWIQEEKKNSRFNGDFLFFLRLWVTLAGLLEAFTAPPSHHQEDQWWVDEALVDLESSFEKTNWCNEHRVTEMKRKSEKYGFKNNLRTSVCTLN